jgi:hypothetical protein
MNAGPQQLAKFSELAQRKFNRPAENRYLCGLFDGRDRGTRP